jgi:hypothetical protein
MPTTTRYSGLRERFSLRAYSGVSSAGLRADFGSASRLSTFGSSASCSGVRLTIHTGLPRHSTVIFSPAFSALMSTSTAAPAARARSEGWKLLTNGTAAKPAPATPAQLEAMIQVRLPLSICWSLMRILEQNFKSGSTRDSSGRVKPGRRPPGVKYARTAQPSDDTGATLRAAPHRHAGRRLISGPSRQYCRTVAEAPRILQKNHPRSDQHEFYV